MSSFPLEVLHLITCEFRWEHDNSQLNNSVKSTSVAGENIKNFDTGKSRLRDTKPRDPMWSKMVEARGVEPLSEDRQRTGSTCVADRLSFAATHAHRQA